MSNKFFKPQSGNQCRLLITGIPGTGKTFIGDHLHLHYGFQHINLEANESLVLLKSDQTRFLSAIKRRGRQGPEFDSWLRTADQGEYESVRYTTSAGV